MYELPLGLFAGDREPYFHAARRPTALSVPPASQSIPLMYESDMAEHQEHRTTTQARAGATPHMARYVLGFGTGLTIIAFAVILWVGG